MTSSTAVVNDGNIVDGLLGPLKSSVNGANNSSLNGDIRASAVLHRSLHCEPLRVVSAKGQYLELSNGQRIFDATGGAAVACLGHGNER